MKNPPARKMATEGLAEHLLRPWKPAKQSIYILTNANIVDTATGSVLPNKTVKLSDGIITSITDSSESLNELWKGSHDAIVLDLAGKYICPGLIDAHVHVTAVPGEKDLGDMYNLDEQRSSMRQPYVCQQMLQRGFTSARDCGGATLALKQAIDENVIQGPRLFIAGHALTQTGGHGDIRGPHNHTDCCGGTVMALGRLCDGVAECIKATREELRCGSNFIKVMCGGG